jgi:hypothetical protein
MMAARCARFLPGVLMAAAIAGCGKDSEALVEVTGTVRLAGKPLFKALVIFSPAKADGPRNPAVGVTDENGQYRLATRGQPGASPGDYVVMVTESEYPAELQGRDVPPDKVTRYVRSLGGRPLPPRYADPIKTPLRAAVSPDKRTFNFNLLRD